MSLVLGIGSSHDASAALFKDGRLIAAVSEERVSRLKCDGERLPQLAIDQVLAMAGVGRGDITHIGLLYAFYPEEYVVRDGLFKEVERKIFRLNKWLAGGRKSGQFWVNAMLHRLTSAESDSNPTSAKNCFSRKSAIDPTPGCGFSIITSPTRFRPRSTPDTTSARSSSWTEGATFE